MTNNTTLTISQSNNTAQNQGQNTFDLSIFEIVDGKVNLTKICQHFGKNINDWTKTQSAKRYIKAFSLKKADTNIIVSLKGGNNAQGSWTPYREVALKLAEWISVDFEIWASEQIDTLLQTGKVELPKPQGILDTSRAMATQMLALVEQLEQEQKENQQKQLMLEAKQEVLESVVTMKAKQFKTVNAGMKADIGKEINVLVAKLYASQAEGDYQRMHTMARDDYNSQADAGQYYLGAKQTSYESNSLYLNWLRNQAKPNLLQRVSNFVIRN